LLEATYDASKSSDPKATPLAFVNNISTWAVRGHALESPYAKDSLIRDFMHLICEVFPGT
jgi:hypothetical protein